MKLKIVVGCLAIVMSLSMLASGQANKLQDLVDIRASSGETEMENRGYILIHAEKSWGSSYTYWWNQSAKKCVYVKTSDGRYSLIKDTINADCYQKENTGMSTGAKVGIAAGAAAIIGAIALASKAHHRENGEHYDTPEKTAEFERGYRDGLYNNPYHNYSNTKEYSSGFEAGVAQRRENLAHSSGWGGYRPHVNLSDLQGIRASSGESEMQSRGFRNVDGFKVLNTSYTIWWNGRTRQCIQVATADGRYDSLMDIGNHPKCR